MAKTGFDIKIGADTSAFRKALRELNAPIKEAQNNLKRINDGLKLNPTNIALLGTKQEELASKIANTKSKIDGLQEALRNLNKEYQTNGKFTSEQEVTYRKLIAEIATSQEELKAFEKEYSQFGSVGLQVLAGVGSQMKELGNSIAEVGKKVSIVSVAIAGIFGKGISYNIDIERSQKAFESFTGSAENAKKAVDNIRADSKKSLFDTTTLIKANQYLVSTGIDAEKARQTINGLADAVALTGGGNDELNRMANNLQQIQNAGKASAIDIRQFAYAGIDVYGMLSDYLGKTTEEIKDMDISFEDLSNAFIQASSEGGKYFNGQAEMANTTAGTLANLKKTFNETLGQLTEKLMPIVTKIMQKIIEFIDMVNANPFLQDLILNIGMLIVVAGPLLVIVGKFISGIGSILTLLPTLFSIGSTVFSGIGAILKGLFTLIMAHPVIAVITAIVGALILLYNKCEWFRDTVNTIVGAIWDFIKAIGEKIGEFFTKTIPGFIEIVKEVFGNLPYYIGLALGWVLGKIYDFGKNIWNWITVELPKIITEIVDWFKSLPEKLWQALLLTTAKVALWLVDMKHKVDNKVSEIVNGIIDWFRNLPTNLYNIGENIIRGLWNGINSAKNWLKNKIINFANGIMDGFKSALGIHSPSTLFEKVIGKNIALGIGEGFDNNITDVVKDMTGKITGITTDLSVTPELATAGNSTITLQFYPQQMTEADLDMAFNYVNRRLGIQL